MTLTVTTLPNWLQLHPCWVCAIWKVTVCTGHYYYIYALHVPYKSELINTQMSMQTPITTKEISRSVTESTNQ